MSSTLIKRIISAIVLAPCFIAAIFFGSWILIAWLILAFIISVYEWYGLARKLEYFGSILFLGVMYMGISYSSFLALREIYSLNIIILFLLMIWSSDIGAYFTGKYFKGPKLIEKVSPNKTWSGFGGALLWPACISLIWTSVFGTHEIFEHVKWYFTYPSLFLTGLLIGAIGQAGDLLVSFLKRQAKVKDTGHLIPGHGGILDRIDSMLLGAPIFLIILTLLSYIV